MSRTKVFTDSKAFLFQKVFATSLMCPRKMPSI